MELAKFSIPTFRRLDIQARLEKLSRKAVKYGNPDITITFGNTRMQEVKTENGIKIYEFVDVIVTGDAPKISGWQLLARVELMGEENLVHVVPGVNSKLDESYRTHNGYCDHCNSLRQRNDVYVLTDGEKQIAVGRTCLRDFLGIDDPKAIVNRAQFFEELRSVEDEDMLGSASGMGYFGLKDVLMVAAAYIRKEGYISKAKQAETGYETTGLRVEYTLKNIPGYSIKVEDEDREWADKTIKFFRSEEYFDNDYMDNIRVLVKQDIIKQQHIPLVSSAVVTAQRKMAPKQEVLESNFVGQVKDRLRDMELTLDKIIFLGSGYYGVSYLHLMKDIKGNVFSWITGNKLEVAEGSTIVLDASIKEHKLYNGIKQTVLTRAKLK